MTRLPLALLVLLLAALAPPAAAQTAPTSFGDAPGALRLPEAVAVAPDGTVLVGDHFSGRVQAFRAGAPVADVGFGLRGDVCGRLGSVSGIARAADGRVYVFDSDNQRVQVFGADGVVQRCWGSRGRGRGQFMTSSGAYAASTGEGGIAVDGRHVFVADTRNDRVQRFTLDGGAATVLAKGVVKQPQGLAVRGRRLLVADDGNHRIVELDAASGRVVRATKNAGAFRLKFPYDVALAPNGDAYVADNNGHRIVVLDRRLKQLRAWGSYGRARGQLVYPRAIALAPGGNVVVADPGNDRVTEYTARGRYV
ncbi:MAG TPA: NHL repeat-containing protein, partial [Solirubrobacteraceae bacterium]|nr:NHL repeat-containing protein [Solirubrobacteraceae bacterium]